ncbi:MAG: tetratricopeptide repeat protein [Desulfovibrionaceae bacterium]
MKLFFPFGSVRNLRAGAWALLYTACLLLPTADKAHAATWQWSALAAGRERLTIQLDSAEKERSFGRTGTHALTLGLRGGPAPLALSGPAPGVTNLVSNAHVRGNDIELSLHNSAFGYMVTRPSPRQIVIDIFPDLLGARWTASGQLAPASARPVALAASAAQNLEPKNTPTQALPVAQAPVAPPANVVPSVPATPVVSPPPVRNTASRPTNAKGLALIPPSLPAVPAIPAIPVEDASAPSPVPVAHGGGDDSALPEMPSSGSLRENTLPPSPVGLPPAPPVTPGELGESAGRFLTDMVKGVLSLSDGAKATTPPSLAPSEGGRGRILTPQNIRASVNSDGPEAWGDEDSLSTRLPIGVTVPPPMAVSPPVAAPEKANAPSAEPTQGDSLPPNAQAPVKQEVRQGITPLGVPPSAAPVAEVVAESVVVPPAPVKNATASPPSATALPLPAPAVSAPSTATDNSPQNMNETRQAASPPKSVNGTVVQGNATRAVVYVNEKGEAVPKPPEPDKMLAEAEALMDKSQFTEALPILQELKGLALSSVLHEKVLYHIADATTAIYAGKALEGFDPITATTSEAMNANLRSTRVPDALFRLGMAHLDVGNIAEAEGYFKALKRRFPHDINVPVAFKNLGLAQVQAGKSAQAVQTLQIILQEYPETSVLREASVGLARALYAENDLDKMAVITDFIDKRWPRYYVQDQTYLTMLAESQVRMNNLENALQLYWLYYNLVPTAKNNDKVLANIGDLYLRTDRLPAAREIFEEILSRYPHSAGAAVALLRLVEQGIHDTPITLEEMFRVFTLSSTPKPPVIYKELIRDYPKDPRSVVAGLKLAIWQLWNKEYTDAMGAAADFIDAYPEHKDVEQARLVIMRAFEEELKNALAEENYGRILILWNGFPLVRERYGQLDPNMRHALARGYIERGDDEKALELLSEFLKTPKNPVYSDYAFTLFFNKYLQSADWNALLDLGEVVKDWPMSANMRSQLDYALALSSENLGLAEKALPLWQKLAARNDIPLYEQAYATYFLAKDAERRRDIKAAYTYNVDTLDRFQRLQDERSDRADPDRIKEAMGSLMDITEVGNRIPESLEWVERYNQFVPEDSAEYPGLRFREARLYRKLGNNSKAKALLEQIVAKAPESAFGKAAAIELRTFEVSRDLRNFIQEK